jgi:hypothetical protein
MEGQRVLGSILARRGVVSEAALAPLVQDDRGKPLV